MVVRCPGHCTLRWIGLLAEAHCNTRGLNRCAVVLQSAGRHPQVRGFTWTVPAQSGASHHLP
jgi:hypothetical protein